MAGGSGVRLNLAKQFPSTGARIGYGNTGWIWSIALDEVF
jgi:hypothetical protein